MTKRSGRPSLSIVAHGDAVPVAAAAAAEPGRGGGVLEPAVAAVAEEAVAERRVRPDGGNGPPWTA